MIRQHGLLTPIAIPPSMGEGSPLQSMSFPLPVQNLEKDSVCSRKTIPSRYDNPFATCWTKPGAIPFRFAAGQTVNHILERLAASDWRGAIVGPHGSGKSTLLETLIPALTAAGRPIVAITLRDGQRRLPSDFTQDLLSFRTAASPSPPIIVVDGYEQLSPLSRIKLFLRCRRNAWGLLVTSHSRTLLPSLIEMSATFALIEQLVAHLCDQVSTHIDPKFVAASHACHGSNVREALFDLYDRYEWSRRNS